MERTTVLCGDVTQPGLGIASQLSTDKITMVIHGAAITSHYGMAETFERINVTGTRNVAKFCRAAGKPMIHISTMSVAGVKKGGRVPFDEDCLDIGQDWESNVYVKSKFLAEGEVLRLMEQGLDARIMRVGNLTARVIDGRFQRNAEDNAFANRLKSIAQLGVAPVSTVGLPLEMSPVDACARAVLLLGGLSGERPGAYHVFNNHVVTLKEVVDVMNRVSPVRFVEDEVFRAAVKKMSGVDPSKVEGLIPDLGEGLPVQIRRKSEQTVKALKRAGFEWPSVDEEYIGKYLRTILE